MGISVTRRTEVSMKNVTRSRLLILGGSVLVCWLAVWLFRQTVVGHMIWPPRRPQVVSDVVCAATPTSSGGQFIPTLDLYVRPVEGSTDSLLITRGSRYEDLPDAPTLWPVYRYDRAGRVLGQVAPDEWGSSKRIVTDTSFFVKQSEVFFVEENGVVKYRLSGESARPLSTHGEYALRASITGGGSVIGVLTADGPQRPESPGPGMIFGTMGGGSYGQHYIEFLRLNDKTRLGEPIRIPLSSIDGIEPWVWSVDGRFLVVADRDGRQMCVVDVPQEGKQP